MQEKTRIIGLYPWSKGLGYACFEGMDSLPYFGCPTTKPQDIKNYIGRIHFLLEEWKPHVIILRVEKSNMTRDSKALNHILIAIRKMAQDIGIQLIESSRKDIKGVFEPMGAFNRQMVAEKICKWFPVLEEHLPPKRKLGYSQHHRMALFDAIALVCTYFYSIR